MWGPQHNRLGVGTTSKLCLVPDHHYDKTYHLQQSNPPSMNRSSFTATLAALYIPRAGVCPVTFFCCHSSVCGSNSSTTAAKRRLLSSEKSCIHPLYVNTLPPTRPEECWYLGKGSYLLNFANLMILIEQTPHPLVTTECIINFTYIRYIAYLLVHSRVPRPHPRGWVHAHYIAWSVLGTRLILHPACSNCIIL